MVRASPAEKALAKSIMSQRNYLVLLNSLANQYGGSRANAQEIHALEQRVMRKWRQELANISAVMAREQHGGMFQPPPALNPIVAPVNAAAVRDVHDLNKVEVDRILGKARLANAAVKQSQASLKEISRLLDDISAMQRHAADAQARINGLTAEKTAAEIARDGLLAELASLRDQLAAAGAERDRHAGIAVGHGNERDALRDERDVLVAANAAAAGAHGVDLAAANAARDVLQAERDALIVQRDQLILDLTAAQTAVAAIQALLDTANAEKNTLEETKAAMTAAYNVLIDKYNDLDDLLSDDALPIDDVAEMLEKQATRVAQLVIEIDGKNDDEIKARIKDIATLAEHYAPNIMVALDANANIDDAGQINDFYAQANGIAAEPGADRQAKRAAYFLGKIRQATAKYHP